MTCEIATDHESLPEDALATCYPLSIAQKRIWSLLQIGRGDILSWSCAILQCHEVPDKALVSETAARLGARHGALRMRFSRFAGGLILQEPDDGVVFSLDEVNLRSLPAEQEVLEWERVIRGEAPYDPLTDMPTKVHLIHRHKGDYLVISVYPMICDPASLRYLARDFAAIYGGLARGCDPFLPEVGSDAKGRVAEEEEFIRSDTYRNELEFWRTYLERDNPDRHYDAASLPFFKRDRAGQARRVETQRFAIGRGLRKEFISVAKAHGLSLAEVFHTILNVLLIRYNGRSALAFGVSTANRQAGNEGVGPFDDLLVLRTELHPDMSFAEAASHVSEAVRTAVAHKVPFERLQEDFYDFEFSGSRALIHVVHGHWPSPALHGDGSQWTVDSIRHVQARNESDILFTTIEHDEEVLLSVEYPPSCIGREVIEAAASHFTVIAAELANGLSIRLREIALYTQDDLARLSAPYADDESEQSNGAVHDLISSIARLKPDAPAIFFGDEAWTHGELEERANRLAHRLAAIGAGTERCVAVALPRSPQAIMAILAVLKCGSAFVPINPGHPLARNRLILSDARVSIILTTSDQRAGLPEGEETIILELDRLDLSAEPWTAPERTTAERQLAYVIYTSGSTGQPKGVAVEHGPLTRHCQSTARVYEMSAHSRELAFLPFTSDGGHERWIVPLMVGGSVVLPTGLWTPAETFLAMRRFGVNNASFPTSYLQQLAEWAEATGDAPPVRLYSFGGEGLPQSTFDLLSRALKAEWLINGYGPTEAIMTPMVWKVRPGVRFDGLYAPIGRAVGRRHIYILDEDLNPVPIGVEGELYIAGDGLARGYVSACRDSERFSENPFDKEGSRRYRTGDRARWLPDGFVEFLGRVDHQVKLRGFRIELGEIEARLRSQPFVKDCAVVLRKDLDNPAIVAYVVPTSGYTVDPTTIRDGLLRQLPDYMVPSAVVCLEALPLNANSKVDRAALPAPESIAVKLDPPETETEIFLASIWQDVLGLDRVGVTQNFFEIGGHSMAALRILSRIKFLRPTADVTIADLFNHQDIRSLAAIIDRPKRRTDDVEMIHLRRSGSRPLLYCFPGLLVSTREYIRLVDYLGPEQPAAGFLCYSLSQEKKMEASVEEITARYAERVRQESKGKPCFFLGWSWGGLLAFEAARMLGNDIDLRLIAMVDVCDMDTDFAVGAIPAFKPGERDDLQKRIEGWLTRTPMREEWVHLLGSMDQHAYEQFLRYVGNSEEDLPVDGPDIGSREHTFFVLIDNALIFRRYSMEPFDCPIRAWAAEDSLNRGLNLIDWRRLSPRASAADIVAGTTHLHIIGDGAFHTRLACRLDIECAVLREHEG